MSESSRRKLANKIGILAMIGFVLNCFLGLHLLTGQYITYQQSIQIILFAVQILIVKYIKGEPDTSWDKELVEEDCSSEKRENNEKLLVKNEEEVTTLNIYMNPTLHTVNKLAIPVWIVLQIICVVIYNTKF